MYPQAAGHDTKNQEQLVAKFKDIYAALVMAESQCIEVVKAPRVYIGQGSGSLETRNSAKYNGRRSLFSHGLLLQQHLCFFSSWRRLRIRHQALHSEGWPFLKYEMPARMWRYGIHGFLELLMHHFLPVSLEHMISIF